MQGEIRKMKTKLDDNNNANYSLPLFNSDEQTYQYLDIQSLIGKEISFHFTGTIRCTSCTKKVKKTYLGGYCFDCFQTAPEASECVIRPELCRGHLGEGRDAAWEEQNHNQPHIVYLTANDVIKVGVTRATQVPTRWIDQGAAHAIKLAETPYRQLAGEIEVALKSEFSDKTNWRKMLKNELDPSLDLVETKWQIEEWLPDDLRQFMSEDDEITTINYPVLEFPQKVSSINIEKTKEVSARLLGIKGQYLIFEGNKVWNVRSHAGYELHFSI